MLASADKSGVLLWNAATHQRRGKPLRGAGGTVHSVAFSPNGRILAAGSDEGIRLWRVRTGKPLGGRFDVQKGIIRGVAFSPDGKTLASVADTGLIRLWQVRTQKQRGLAFHGLTDHQFVQYGAAFSPVGHLLA